MADQLQIILPERSDDAFSDAMRTLVSEICARTNTEGGFGLGGENGYSVDCETDVFIMRRFYWGDCDCGADERSEEWHAANPHADDCFQVELRRRHKAYDEQSGYNAIDAAARAPGTMEEKVEEVTDDFMGVEVTSTVHTSWRTEAGEVAHDAWCKAHDERSKQHRKLTLELCRERDFEPDPFVWRCTCGTHERTMAADIGHRDTCALMLPNFEYKPTGFKAEWYKWIGRDNKVSGAMPPINEMLAACISSLTDTSTAPAPEENDR